MKVSELIKLLQNEDPEDMVVVRGYEGGVNEVHEVLRIQIVRYYHQKHASYLGLHARAEDVDDELTAGLPWAVELEGARR